MDKEKDAVKKILDKYSVTVPDEALTELAKRKFGSSGQ